MISKRIVGGSVSNDRAWPWQAALLLDNTQVCGGSLIRSNWILTACHCFTGTSMNASLYLNPFFSPGSCLLTSALRALYCAAKTVNLTENKRCVCFVFM